MFNVSDVLCFVLVKTNILPHFLVKVNVLPHKIYNLLGGTGPARPGEPGRESQALPGGRAGGAFMQNGSTKRSINKFWICF